MDNEEKKFVIDVHGISKSFGAKTVVRSLDMRVAQGEIYGFLGPNGSGKTTFIRMLCGLLRPDKGSGTCLGYDILSQSDQIKPHVGYMSQKFSLYEDLTVYENLDFTARTYGLKNRGELVNRYIGQMGLERFRNQLAGSLSGGWKQRLALTSCILHQPQLLLLDEPTAGVDPGARRDFWDEVHRLAAEGITSLISTHYMDEAERCHRLAYIAYGDLLASGTVEELIQNSGLVTWHVTGKEMHSLSEKLRNLPGVEQVVAFGNTLHISGVNQKELEAGISPYMNDLYQWKKAETNLEEVFIHLMQKANTR
ncbi:MAG: ABC transporter ATP-binding protein [Desulfococcaceae bacterium]